jgi:hypothetical protein
VRIPDGPGGSGDPLGTGTGLGGSGDGCLVVRMMFSLTIWTGSRPAAVLRSCRPEGRPRATSCGAQHHAAAGVLISIVSRYKIPLAMASVKYPSKNIVIRYN